MISRLSISRAFGRLDVCRRDGNRRRLDAGCDNHSTRRNEGKPGATGLGGCGAGWRRTVFGGCTRVNQPRFTCQPGFQQGPRPNPERLSPRHERLLSRSSNAPGETFRFIDKPAGLRAAFLSGLWRACVSGLEMRGVGPLCGKRHTSETDAYLFDTLESSPADKYEPIENENRIRRSLGGPFVFALARQKGEHHRKGGARPRRRGDSYFAAATDHRRGRNRHRDRNPFGHRGFSLRNARASGRCSTPRDRRKRGQPPPLAVNPNNDRRRAGPSSTVSAK
jgi:hypothetical protein